MSDGGLEHLASRAGLALVWHDVFGNTQHVSPDTLRSLLTAFGLDVTSEATCRDEIATLEVQSRRPPRLLTAQTGAAFHLRHAPAPARVTLADGTPYDIAPHDAGSGMIELPAIDQPGYHTLHIGDHAITLAIAPPRAYSVQDALRRVDPDRAGKIWGIAAQIYGLPRAHDGGIGDFAALAALARSAARHGADAIAISPVHALYASEPRHYGPYGPSSRIALNPLYASLDCPDAPPAGSLIDWPTAAARRYDALRGDFTRNGRDPAFHAYERVAPPAIKLHALFEAIVAHQIEAGAGRDWRQWQPELRDPASQAVRNLAAAEAEAIAFHLFAQWRAVTSLQAAQSAARDAGMAIGLIADLAVGADPAGSDAWSRPDEVLRGASVGAPPDEFNRAGQNWGLTAFSPRGLQRSGFAALRDMLRAAFAPAGGIRVDHAMGLSRLWIIPDGGAAKDGAYLHYPFDDMRRLVVLESHLNQGIVVAEDLGTVPEGFRESLAASGIAGMSILWFERDGDRFIPPAHWREATAAMTTTHDLATVAGWWRGTDIEWRDRLGIAGEDRAKRAHDRPLLWAACTGSGAVPSDMPDPDDADAIADALAVHVAGAASDLLILPIEDALALPEQPNIPGTIDEHPNWRRRLEGDAASLLDAPRVAARLAKLDQRRKRC